MRTYSYLDFELTAKKILMIAPHQDDELFGCYGLLSKIKRQNASIRVVYLSDGSLGAPGLERSEELTFLRCSEAKQVLHHMHIDEFSFKNMPDGELAQHLKEITLIIKNEIINYSPDTIIYPHHKDVHPDHMAASRSVKRALNEANVNINLIGYEIWNKIDKPNLYIDLNEDEVEIKLSLAQMYRSQMELYDYISLLKKLLVYRGEENGSQYAEAYYVYNYIFEGD